MAQGGTGRLLYDFNAENDSELAVTEGSVVEILECRDDGWILAKLDTKVGLVPESYVEAIEAPAPAKPDKTEPASIASGPGDAASSRDKDKDKDKARDRDKDKKRDKDASKDKDRSKEKDKDDKGSRSRSSRDLKDSLKDSKDRDKDKDKEREKSKKSDSDRVSRRRSGELKTAEVVSPKATAEPAKTNSSSRFRTMSATKFRQELKLHEEATASPKPAPATAEAPAVMQKGPEEQKQGAAAPDSPSPAQPSPLGSPDPSGAKRPLPSVPKRAFSAIVPKLPPKPARPGPANSPPPVPAKTLRPKSEMPGDPLSAPNSPAGATPPGSPAPESAPAAFAPPAQPGSTPASPTPANLSPAKSRQNSLSSNPLARTASGRIVSASAQPEPKPEPVGPFVPDPERDQQRFFIVKELVNTERTYVAGLKEAIDKFYKPMLQLAQAKADPSVNMDDLRLIFSQLENLLPLNQNLLQKMEERIQNWTPTTPIGDVFTKFAPFLKMYTTYSNTYDAALETLERIAKFQWFINVCEKKSNVENLIITPVQRIPRYTLLLTDLLRKTPREHPDYTDIEKSLTTSKEVAEHVNKSINTYKNVARLTEAGLSHLLAPHRFLLREGSVTIVTPESPGRERKKGILSGVLGSDQKRPVVHFLLFNDMLAWIDAELDEYLMPKKGKNKPLIGGKKGKGKDYQWPLYLLWLRDIGIKTGFELSGPNKTLACYFETPEVKDQWWKTLSEGIRLAIMQQPSHQDDILPDDAAITLAERCGKHVFLNGDVYDGWWLSGRIHGHGKLETFGTVFEGDFDGTYKNGTGKITYLNGQVYEGSWRMGRPFGIGIVTWPDGTKFEGEMKDGKRLGHGVIKYPNGDYYDGEWKSDVVNGAGKLFMKSRGTEYEGNFLDGKFHGVGTLRLLAGAYDGSFEKGLRSGRGVMTYKDGSKYDGEWKEDKYNGQGKKTFADGSTYEGEWHKGLREGKGHWTHADTSYDGMWKLDKPDGSGVWSCESGTLRKYEGEFVQGRKQGKGTLTYASGDKYVGEVQDGTPHGTGKLTTANGASLEGKWLFGAKDGKFTLSSQGGQQMVVDIKEEDGVFTHVDPPATPFFDVS